MQTPLITIGDKTQIVSWAASWPMCCRYYCMKPWKSSVNLKQRMSSFNALLNLLSRSCTAGAVWLPHMMEESKEGLTQCCKPTFSCSFQRSHRKGARLEKGNVAFDFSITVPLWPHTDLPNPSLVALRISSV